MFKFGFIVDIDGDDESQVLKEENNIFTELGNILHEAEEVVPTAIQINSKIELTNPKNIVCVGNHKICYINPSPDSSDILNADSKHSDLLSGQYEGGMKIWECNQDLADFLNNHNLSDKCQKSILDTLEGKSVLDLGCGAGILGILALNHKAIVHFQDYNKDVILNFTNPNIILNFEDDIEEILKKCKFFSGDWESYDKLTSNTKFDVILTSETIYNPSNHKKLISVFKNKLKLDGVIYLAAKTYYFGVGGGIRQFEKCISDDKSLKSTIVWRCHEGVQREIMEIKFNN